MNILYCGDQKMRDGLFLSVLSLMKHTSQPLNVFILTMQLKASESPCKALDQNFVDGLSLEMKKVDKHHKVKLIDITKLVQAELPTENLKTFFTPYCMLRLYADKIPELPDKLLYLDTDVLAYRNFDELYNTELGDNELAGVLDNYGQHFFHQKNLFTKDYLNSGVLLLNLKKIRETELFTKCRERCRAHKMLMPDQSAINKLVRGKIILPRRFNEQKEMREDTVLRHFTNTIHFLPYFRVQAIKPWQVEKLHKTLKTHEFDDIIDYYKSHIEEVNRGRSRG